MKFLKRFQSQLVLQFERTQKYLKGKDIDEIIKKSQSISSVTMSDNLFDKMLTPLPDSDEKIYPLTISNEKDTFKIILTYYICVLFDLMEVFH